MSTALAILTKAREILAKPDSHTKGVFARDVSGRVVGSNSPIACQFCARGALNRADTIVGGTTAAYGKAVDALEKCIHIEAPYKTLEVFNDRESTTHADILALFDRAIIIKESQA